jgi:predicted dehydrogenase
MINFGLIGLGKQGQRFISNINLISSARIVSLCATKFKSYVDLIEKPVNTNHRFYIDPLHMINDNRSDCIILATPPFITADLAILALDCNKNVICEKPFCLSYGKALEIQKAVERTKKNFIINYTHLWQPSLKDLEKRLKNSIKKLIVIQNFGSVKRIEYSPLWDYCHAISIAIKLLGAPTELDIFINEDGLYDVDYYINRNSLANLEFGYSERSKVTRVLSRFDKNGDFAWTDDYTTNPLRLMLDEYIDKLEKNEFHTNIEIGVEVTRLLEELEKKLNNGN